ncbi:MAG TPA: FG-GAP-like repeat-containing protein [Telluria sp.]|nr:FG-GAP-like repeat-containing protein [Telluria sp.]
MEYRGTDGNDNIDQATLGLPDGIIVYGGKGNDTITIARGNVLGEAGNDTIRTTAGATAAYWNSPSAIDANLGTGVVSDGFGGTDTLIGVHSIADSPHDDKLHGSTIDDRFWLGWGSNTVTGGGGIDTVMMQGVKQSEVTISYDKATSTFTVVKNLANGDKGTDVLKGVSVIWLTGDNVLVTPDMFDDAGGFLRSRTFVASTDMEKILQLRAGDFNGDGKADILAVRGNIDAGITPEPLQILTGNGSGAFNDGSAALFAGGIPKVNFVPRIFTADFNKDGISDIFNPDFGVDAPPFPGGQNSLFLSDRTTGQLHNATATLPQALRQNHGTSIGDVNKDGYPDIFVNALNDLTRNANQLLINDRTGHFTPAQSLLPAVLNPAGHDNGNTWSLLDDLNNDGYADIVLGTFDFSPFPSRVFMNDGTGSFANAQAFNLPRSGVADEIVVGIETMDLNGDALPDLVLSVSNGGPNSGFYKKPYLQFLINDGGGNFHDETALRLPQSTASNDPSTDTAFYLSATPVDLNGDGYEDLLADGAYSGVSVAYMNDGFGRFSAGWSSPAGGHVVAMDVNGDGKMDLVESTDTGYSILMNAFPIAVPQSHQYTAGHGGERIAGNAHAETIRSGNGNDTIDGGAGLDTVIYPGNRAGFTIAKSATGFTVSGALGTDTLAQVERLSFGDTAVALDIDSVGGQAYRVYNAVLGRAPDAAGLGYWMASMDKGMSLGQVASYMIAGEEFIKNFGANLSNQALVQTLYQNILDRAPEQAGLAYWVEALDKGLISQAEALAFISEGFENRANVDPTIATGFDYAPWG